MPRFLIQHVTRYAYEQPVRDSANQIMLYPFVDTWQEVISHVINITGNPAVSIHHDFFGNQVGTFSYSKPHSELVIQSRLTVETAVRNMPSDDQSYELQWNELEPLKQHVAYLDFLRTERFDGLPEAKQIVNEELCGNRTPLQSATDVCKYVFDNFTYKKGITTVETTLDEIWKLKSGVCQDFAHILLAMLRLMDIPARYVSGYVCPRNNSMRGEGATHAWVEAWIPFYGWLGLDPTNNCIVNENYVRLAVGKSFSDCSPVKGTYRGASEHTMQVFVSVSYEDGSNTDSIDLAIPVQSVKVSDSENSFRRHIEMQQQ